MLSRLSLRTVLFAAVAALAALLIGLTVQHSVVAFQQRTAVQAIQEGNATGDQLLAAAGNWAAERGRTAALLNSAVSASPSDTALLGQLRQQADVAFKSALERLRLTHAGLSELAKAEAAVRQVEAIRGQVDSDLTKSGDQRASQTASRGVAALTTLIEASQQLRLAAEMRVDNAEARIAEFQRLKHLAWVTSEFAGRERAAIAAAISGGRAISSERLDELLRQRGNVELAWGLIDLQAARSDTPAALKSAVERIKAGYFGEFQALRERVYKAGTSDARYPVDANQWVSAATKAIDEILGLNEAVGSATAMLARETAAQATKALAVNIGLMVLGLVVAGFAFWIAAVRVARPLNQLAGTTQRLAEGDTDLAVPETERKDEVGTLARSIEVFRNNLIENRRLAADREAENDAKARRAATLDRLAKAFEAAVGMLTTKLASAATEMEASARSLTSTAEGNTEAATSLASAAEETSASVQTVAAASEELATSIREISGQAALSSGTAARAVDQANEAQAIVQGLVAGAAKIGSVVSLINDIAGQTNLLALNATIEAARAGEAGRGFAVVAAEVKELASQTTKATGEIAAQIGEIQQSTEAVVSAIATIAKVIEEMSGVSVSVAAAMEEQGAATGEIARNVQEAARGTEQVTTSVVTVRDGANSTGAASSQVLSAAQEVAQISSHLSQEVQTFLHGVQAA
ncbi:MAG: methyl-accepting chemotaxis protein [Proteobacteria bacterium]|nr:methyl-accepting chemotaxis protein [Pseudomonadota bacterium]